MRMSAPIAVLVGAAALPALAQEAEPRLYGTPGEAYLDRPKADGETAEEMAPANGWIVYGGAGLEYLDKPDGPEKPPRSSLEAYVEAERNHFYGGIWAKIASDHDYNEIDFYGGYRRDLDSGFSYDLSYYAYTYPTDSSSNYGEVSLLIGQTLGDSFYVDGNLAVDPDSQLANVYFGLDYYAGDKWIIGANWGTYQEDAKGGGKNAEEEWDIGATYSFNDTTALDLRYYDGTDYKEGYFGMFLSWDSTLFGGG